LLGTKASNLTHHTLVTVLPALQVNWDLPQAPFIPDKWYVRVAWAVILVGVTVYVNAKLVA
jgi:hypothetical protein